MLSIKPIITHAICAAALLTAHSAQASNLFVNAGFEDGTDPWVLVESEVQPWDDKAKTGTNTLFIKTFLSNTSAFQSVDVTAGSGYQFDANFLFEDSTADIIGLSGKLIINWLNDDTLLSSDEAAIDFPAAANVYSLSSLLAAAPDTANKADVGFVFTHPGEQLPGGALSVFGDDFSFTAVEIPEPASIALLSLAGLLTLSRKR
ncbi:hypothetical protein KS4_17480 [Poriferisphaera corsica]|uniref:PEP-CTERM protein-sorting domain-containing protein n=1 Tax=Poriferisphaera corsica TaxID=2528020 RepID=A0A517YU55_9BACT|nr:PEP-CTERM sorting domain-containing protein [Poriferisphaera corsica]QDU33692.1 hypothetical protein KS4_17480 [Poriferisphaera corsica]